MDHLSRAAEDDPDFAAEVPAFIAEIRRIFSEHEICSFVDELEREKFLAPNDVDLGIEDDRDEPPLLPHPPVAYGIGEAITSRLNSALLLALLASRLAFLVFSKQAEHRNP